MSSGTLLFRAICWMPLVCAIVLAATLAHVRIVEGQWAMSKLMPVRETVAEIAGYTGAVLLPLYPVVVLLFGWLPSRPRIVGYLTFYACWTAFAAVAIVFVILALD